MDPYRELAALGLKLPDTPTPVANCIPFFFSVAVFGEGSRHARSAVGMWSWPNAMTLAIEAIVEVAR
jgi:hypothetical protein